MPYDPGVTNISGQLLAQGILGRAQAYGQGIQGIAAGLQAAKIKKENDAALLAKAKSTETFIKNHPEMYGGQDAVDQITAQSPQETPLARYARMTQATSDAIVGSKLQAEQQQAAMSKQAMAAQAFAMQQQQLKASQTAAAAARLGAYLPGGSTAPQWPGSGTGPWAGQPTGAAPSAPGTAMPPSDPVTAAVVRHYALTGQVPDDSTMSAIMSDTSRQSVAETRAAAEKAITDARDQARTQIAAATDATNQAKLQAKNAAPEFHTDPETGIRVMVYNGQPLVLPGQVDKDPNMAAIDQMEKSGDLTHTQAVTAKKNVILHRSTFSPNGTQGLVGAIQAANNPGAGAQVAAPNAAMTPDQFFGTAPNTPAAAAATPPTAATAQGSTLPTIATQADYAKLPPGSSYIGPDGQIAVKRTQDD